MEIDELLKKWKELLKLRTPNEDEPTSVSRRGKITAAELHAELEKDEDYQRWLKKKKSYELNFKKLMQKMQSHCSMTWLALE